jgi:hypothetical protein
MAFHNNTAYHTTWLASLNPEPGTRMWVRERTTCITARDGEIKVSYDADGSAPDVWMPFPDRLKQKPIVGQRLSMGCYREVSRITDTVSAIKIERAHDISDDDCFSEGLDPWGGRDTDGRVFINPVAPNEGGPGKWAYGELWKHLHGAESWSANPFVVAISYSVIQANIDAPEARAA